MEESSHEFTSFKAHRSQHLWNPLKSNGSLQSHKRAYLGGVGDAYLGCTLCTSSRVSHGVKAPLYTQLRSIVKPQSKSAFPLADMTPINCSQLLLSDCKAHKMHLITRTAFPLAVSQTILSSSARRYCSVATFYRWSLNFLIKSFRYSMLF